MYDKSTSQTSEVKFIVENVLLLLVLIPSVIDDCIHYRVRNPIILFGLFSGFLYQCFSNQLPGVCIWISGCTVPILILGVLFFIKVLGAGDIKLFSVIGGFLGPQFIVRTIVIAFIIGALLSVIQLIRYGNLMNRLQYLATFISVCSKERKPRPYYVSDRDGRECVVHFTIAIALAVPFCMVCERLGIII